MYDNVVPHCMCQPTLRIIIIFPIGLMVLINKTLLHNGNCPIMDPITKMGVAHTMMLH